MGQLPTRNHLCVARAHGGAGREADFSPVTKFRAQHGKLPTKMRSPPLLQPDAELWHPPGWQPLDKDHPSGIPALEGWCPP